jgi:hypothetical protein
MMSCMHAGVLRGRPAPSEAAAQIVNYAAPLCSIVHFSLELQLHTTQLIIHMLDKCNFTRTRIALHRLIS